MNKERGFWSGTLQLIVASLVLGLIGFFARIAIVEHAFNQMNHAASDATRKILDDSNAAAERQRQKTAAIEESKRRAAVEEKKQRSQIFMTGAQTQPLDSRDEALRAAAWSKYFRRSKACENPADWNANIQCNNAYMRARRDFDARWASNQHSKE